MSSSAACVAALLVSIHSSWRAATSLDKLWADPWYLMRQLGGMETTRSRTGERQPEARQKMIKSLVANCSTSKSEDTRVCTPISAVAQLLKSALLSKVATMGSLTPESHNSWAETVAMIERRRNVVATRMAQLVYLPPQI